MIKAETWVPVIELAINIMVPIGGVRLPIARLRMIRMPNWIGSIPRAFTVGISSGTNTIIAALPSINIPRTSKNRLSANRNISGLSNSDVIISATVWAVRSQLNIQANAEQAMIMSIIPAVEAAVSNRASPISATFISRVKNRPMPMANTTAIAPASVGVKAPMRIPPIITSTRTSAGIACHSACPSSRQFGASVLLAW
ncbi:hypothetical protein D3C78_1240540 [compost metagenome]